MKTFLLALLVTAPGFAQFGPPPPAAPPKSGRDGAPVDLTGNWVSIVAEDWRWRMLTPLKGDAASIPYKPDARKVIDAWDPAKDEAAGLQCKAYVRRPSCASPAACASPGRTTIP